MESYIRGVTTGYCSSPPSTPSSLRGLLLIHRQPPPASTYDCSSTGSCSSSLHRALLHRLLFNQPSPRAPIQPSLHGYCSSSPPSSTVHPALQGVVLFILPSTGSCSSSPNRLERSGSCSSRGNATGPVHPLPPLTIHADPPATLTVHPERQHRSASASSSSERIARRVSWF